MKNLDEAIIYFIENNYIALEKPQLYSAFLVLENFNKQFYNDKYINLISDHHNHDDLTDKFKLLLIKDIVDILEEHKIFINFDQEPTLDEITKISEAILLLSNLENYSDVEYILTSNNDPYELFISILEYYTTVYRHRLYEVIKDINESIIEALKALILDKQKHSNNDNHIHHIEYKKSFLEFTKNTDYFYKEIMKSNLINLKIQDMSFIPDTKLIDRLRDKIDFRLPEAVLDILSILIICKDSYEIPLMAFKKNYHIFTDKEEDLLKIEPILINMISDFTNFRLKEKNV